MQREPKVCPYYTHAYEPPQAKQGMQCNRTHKHERRREEEKRYERARGGKEVGEECTCTKERRRPHATRCGEQEQGRHQRKNRTSVNKQEGHRKTRRGRNRAGEGRNTRHTAHPAPANREEPPATPPPHPTGHTSTTRRPRRGEEDDARRGRQHQRRMDGMSSCHREKTSAYRKSKRYARCPRATETAT